MGKSNDAPFSGPIACAGEDVTKCLLLSFGKTSSLDVSSIAKLHKFVESRCRRFARSP
jgi:hypothetical protein